MKQIHMLIKSRLTKQLPCQLCGLDQQQAHSLCTDCWQALPWLKKHIHRHEQNVLVAHDYAFPIDRVIQKFKYEQQLHFQVMLAHSLLSLTLPKVEALVAMPISTQRLIERGYNQMLLISQIVAQQLKRPIWQPIIRSAQHAQKGLSRTERLAQMNHQFKPRPQQQGRYKKVLILDDVITTGSSIHALSDALYRLGCTQVEAVCIAAAHEK